MGNQHFLLFLFLCFLSFQKQVYIFYSNLVNSFGKQSKHRIAGLSVNPSPNDRILALTKFKAFADDKFNIASPITTQCHILKCSRYIVVENIVRKGEIACNKQFLLFLQCFLPYMALIFHFKCTLKCHLPFVSIWTSLKFCRLVMG